MSSATINLKGSGPFRVADPAGVTVHVSANGSPGIYIVEMRIESIEYTVSKQIELTSFGEADVLFVIRKTVQEPMMCDAVFDLKKDSQLIATRKVRTELLPLYTFDKLASDLVSSICHVIKATTERNGDRTSLSEDISRVYDDLSFIQIYDNRDSRYLEFTAPELVPQFGDGTKNDVALSYLKTMYSKGYHCCLVRAPDGLYVGVSNESDDVNDSDMLDRFIFLRPSDACESIDQAISIDLAKSTLRAFFKVAKKGKDYSVIT